MKLKKVILMSLISLSIVVANNSFSGPMFGGGSTDAYDFFDTPNIPPGTPGLDTPAPAPQVAPTCEINAVKPGILDLRVDGTISTSDKAQVTVKTNTSNYFKVVFIPPNDWYEKPNSFQGNFSGSVRYQLPSMGLYGSVGLSTMHQAPSGFNTEIPNHDGFNMLFADEEINIDVVGYTESSFTPGYYKLVAVVSCVPQ